VRILLVDDHLLFREGVVRLLNSEPGFEVAGHCSSVDEAIDALSRSSVDIILLDIDLGERRGSELLVRAREAGFRGRFLVVTAGVGVEEGSELLRMGAGGIFLKHSPPGELAESIRAVLRGDTWIDPHFSGLEEDKTASRGTTSRKELTARERAVLKGVFEGLANKEIAAELHISESSVKAALQQLFEKTGVRTRAQLVRVALERYLDQI